MSDKILMELGQNMSQVIDKIIFNALNSGLPMEFHKPTVVLSSREKLKRMKNPQCADDYGLSMTTEKLSSFKEGREFLNEMMQIISYQKATIYKRDCHEQLL